MAKGKTETLHFTIDPSCVRLPRQAYYMEDRQDWALDFLDSLTSLPRSPYPEPQRLGYG